MTTKQKIARMTDLQLERVVRVLVKVETRMLTRGKERPGCLAKVQDAMMAAWWELEHRKVATWTRGAS